VARFGALSPRRIAVPLGWMLCAYVVVRLIVVVIGRHDLGGDGHAYWLTAHRGQLYGLPPGSRDAYLYSPLFAALIWPLAVLPWPVFLGVWMAAELLAYAWLVRPLGWGWGVPVWMLCCIEVTQANIQPFLAIAIVLGLRRPAAWAFPLLTKVTLGLGPVWFAARGEWRRAGVAIGATGAIALVGVALAPSAWSQWLHFLSQHSGGQSTLLVRLALALALTLFAARTDRAWLLAPAALLATPVLVGISYLGLLAGIPRLMARQEEPRAAVDPVGELVAQ
jgi:hypothetical protein